MVSFCVLQTHLHFLHFFLALRGDSAGLDSKYFERRDDSIPIYGLSSNLLFRGKASLILTYHLEHCIDYKLQNILSKKEENRFIWL